MTTIQNAPSLAELLDALESLMLYADRDCPSDRRSSQLSNAITQAMLLLEWAKDNEFTGLQTADIQRILASREQIAVVWSAEDVKQERPDLDDDQSWQVLQRVEERHDCNYGITWSHIRDAADEMFPAKKPAAF
jgi:hypothetical protein